MPQERQEELFKQMQALASIEKAVEQVNNYNKPEIVVWFSNYFGSMKDDSCAWYIKNIFTKVPKKAKFQLTDLTAWALFSVNKKQLKQNYPSLIKTIETVQKNKTSIDSQECPLITSSSGSVDNDITHLERFRLLRSKDFFQWLLNIKNTALLSDDICNKLCKESSNEIPDKDRLSFCLADIGYTPTLLNRSLSKLNNKTMVETDAAKINRLLQYWEGVFYAQKIVLDAVQRKDKQCSIIFMLPNKEFTYYTIPEEQTLFENFKRSIETVLKESLPQGSDIAIDIRFQPFAYGSKFNDMPYKSNGKVLKKNKLIELLRTISESNLEEQV